MDIEEMFRRGVDTFKNNYVLAVPPLIATIILNALMYGLMMIMSLTGMLGFKLFEESNITLLLIGGIILGAITLLTLSFILTILAQGLVVGMSREAVESGKTTIGTGIDSLKGNVINLVVAAILMEVIILIGYLLLILPGLVASFLLIFTVPVLVIENVGAVTAVKRSIGLIKRNFTDAILFVVGLFICGVVISAIGGMLMLLPAGFLFFLVIMAAFQAYTGLMTVIFYLEAKGK